MFVSKAGLEYAKRLVEAYKKGEVREMTPEVWRAKKVVDATLHPGMFFFFSSAGLCSSSVENGRRAGERD